MRRRLRNAVLSCLMVTAMSVGLAGIAHATITNDPGTLHYKVHENGQCLMFDPDTNLLEQYRCLNAPSEEFIHLYVGPDGSYNVLLKNYWTGLCMGVAEIPLVGGRIYGMPCDVNNVREYWHFETLGGGLASYFLIHAAMGDNLCMDKDRGNDTQSLPIQVWTCSSVTHSVPFETEHDEQWWYPF